MEDCNDIGTGRPEAKKRFRVRDFLRTEGVAVESPDDDLSPEDTLIEGTFLHTQLRPGLFLHSSDVIEERAFTARSVLQEGLSCIFFLDGDVALKIGDRSFDFAGRRNEAITGAAIMTARRETFERSSRRRQALRHLVVSATPEWLNVGGIGHVEDESGTARFFNAHLSDHRWVLSPRMLELVRQVLAPSPLAPSLHNLYLEGRAVEIVVETLATVAQADRRRDDGGLIDQREHTCLRRALDLIEADPAAALSVEAIAREAGISASGLQRLFRASFGLSVFEHVRRLRLEKARDALRSNETTVLAASLVAGYSSPENFATAFRRQFGLSPREMTKGEFAAHDQARQRGRPGAGRASR